MLQKCSSVWQHIMNMYTTLIWIDLLPVCCEFVSSCRVCFDNPDPLCLQSVLKSSVGRKPVRVKPFQSWWGFYSLCHPSNSCALNPCFCIWLKRNFREVSSCFIMEIFQDCPQTDKFITNNWQFPDSVARFLIILITLQKENSLIYHCSQIIWTSKDRASWALTKALDNSFKKWLFLFSSLL